MNSELVPAVVGLAGGGALLVTIAAAETSRERAMRASRRAYTLTFPKGAAPEAALTALGSLAGTNHTNELVAEVVGDMGGIHHLLHVPAGIAGAVEQQLTAAFPGLSFDEATPHATGRVTQVIRILVGQRALLRADDPAAASRALLAGLGALRDDERVSLRWALRPERAPEIDAESATTSLRGRAERAQLAARLSEPGFGIRGLLLVRAASPARSRELAEHVVAVLRARRGAGQGLIARRGRVPGAGTLPSTARSRGWLSTKQLLPLLAWPLGTDPIPGVTTGGTRRLPVPRTVAREGRRLLIGRDPYGERPVALTAAAARTHMLVTGASGVGKSVVLARGVLDDLVAGYGGVVLDPKADLVETILERVPPEHAQRVVVLDPSAPGPVPALDLFSGDPDLCADVVVGALATIFHGAWHVRSDYYGRLAIRSLASLPGATLADVPRLFLDASYRRHVIARVDDPATIGAWQAYAALSPAEQLQHVQAPMARISGLMARPALRAVIASHAPKLDIGRVLAERKLLLVSLSPGRLGEPAARLLSALIMYLVWNAIEARASLRPEQRHPVFVTVDELATVAHLPVSFELLSERMRGLGAGLTVAAQSLGRLPDSLRESLLVNCNTLVTFRASHTEARRLAAELSGLTDADLMGLRAFEVAARVGSGTGAAAVTLTGRTEPLPAPTGQAEAIRARSACEYGSDPAAPSTTATRPHDADGGCESFGRTRSAS